MEIKNKDHEYDLVKSYLLSKDPAVFAQIYEITVSCVYKWVYSRTGNRYAAEDITSETYITLLEIIHKFNYKSKLSTFIIGIALNKLRQYLQKPQNSLEVPLDEDFVIVSDIHVEAEEEPSPKFSKSEIKQVLERLDEKDKELIKLRFIEEKSVKEVAALLETTDNNVRVMQHRALKNAAEIAKELFSLQEKQNEK